MRNNIIFTSNGIIGTNFPKEFIAENLIEKQILIIDNGTYHTGNYNNRQENLEKFYKYGAKNIQLITIDKDNTKNILNYDVCYVMGGSIANLVELVHTTDIKNVLEIFLEKGIYIGESAGSVILDKDVEWYFNLKRGTKPKYDRIFENYKGLGFIEQHIYPHYNKEDNIGIEKIIKYKEKINILNDGDYIQFRR